MAYQLEPFHQAAWDGNLASINQLLQEDRSRLNVPVLLQWRRGCTPLMLAAYRGHDAVVARLLALGADMEPRDYMDGLQTTHWACMGDKPSSLALLLDAGAPINGRSRHLSTPLITAACNRAIGCVKLLVARCGDGLELDATISEGWTALHWAAYRDHVEIVRLLLQAGANPTIRNVDRQTALDVARLWDREACIPLLEAALADAQRPRLLLKARALLDASHKIRLARAGITEQQENGRVRRSTRLAPKQTVRDAAPAYLKRRVSRDEPLPRVTVNAHADEQLAACLKYALGLEGGGGVAVVEGQAPPVGMVKEVFVELCEFMVPKWDRKNV